MELETFSEMRERIAALETAHAETIALKAALKAVGMLDYNDTLNELMPRLGAEINPLRAEIEQRKAMRKKYSPIYAERVMGIPGLIESAQKRIWYRGEEVVKQRKKLTDAGLTAEQARQMKPDYNAEEDNALIASFQTEMEQWERFNATGLHEDLPADAGERLRNHLEVFPKKRAA